ncbi:MAG: hypothetical protein IJ720_00535 [Clostridia bacterium]|nr:hypothetical protein [Clostridia bacterium]MBR1703831.1 hypothetical protein [Clostridia bacterium]
MSTIARRDSLSRWGEPLFFFAYVVFMTATVLQTTMYTEMAYFPKLFIAMRYFAFVVGAGKVLLDLYEDLRQVRGSRERLLDWVSVVVKYIGMAALVVAVSVTADERALAFLLVLLLAARGVSVNKIFRVTLWLQIGLAAFVFLSAASGLIIDLRFERAGAFNRHALGYWFPSYVMSYYFFILLLLFWTRKTPFKWTTVALLEGLNLLLFLLTDARLGLLMNTGLIGAELVRSIEPLRKPIHAFAEKVLGTRGLGSLVQWGWALLPELLCGFLLLLFRFPTSTLAQKTDGLLSNRIYYAYIGIQQYGLHLLGNNIEWIGYGARADMSAVEKTYNFVDCAYVFILLNYGVLLFLGMLFCLFWVSARLGQKGELHKAFLYGLIFLYCFVEPRLLEVNMNTFLFLTAPLLARPPYLRRWLGRRKQRRTPGPKEETVTT